MPSAGCIAMLLVVASRTELSGSILMDAGKVGEIQQQRGSEATEACHVEGQRLARFQVVQWSVTRRPKSWEALIEGSERVKRDKGRKHKVREKTGEIEQSMHDKDKLKDGMCEYGT